MHAFTAPIAVKNTLLRSCLTFHHMDYRIELKFSYLVAQVFTYEHDTMKIHSDNIMLVHESHIKEK